MSAPDASCLQYLISLPLGLSRKQAKDLLRFRALTVQREVPVRHDTQLGPNDVVTIAVRKRMRDDTLEHHGLKIIHLDDAIVGQRRSSIAKSVKFLLRGK